jgi:hypothetical protein
VTKPLEKHRLVNGVLNSKMGKSLLKIVSIEVIPLQATQKKKHAENSQNNQ